MKGKTLALLAGMATAGALGIAALNYGNNVQPRNEARETLKDVESIVKAERGSMRYLHILSLREELEQTYNFVSRENDNPQVRREVKKDFDKIRYYERFAQTNSDDVPYSLKSR